MIRQDKNYDSFITLTLIIIHIMITMIEKMHITCIIHFFLYDKYNSFAKHEMFYQNKPLKV